MLYAKLKWFPADETLILYGAIKILLSPYPNRYHLMEQF